VSNPYDVDMDGLEAEEIKDFTDTLGLGATLEQID